MKKILFVSFLIFGSVNVFSQVGIGLGGGGFGMGMRIPMNRNNGAQRSQNIEKQVQRMKSDLRLTDDQTIKVRGLLIERDRRRNGSNPMDPKEFNQRLQQLLTPDQYNKLVQLRQDKRQRKQQNSPAVKDSLKPSSPPKKDDWDDVYN